MTWLNSNNVFVDIDQNKFQRNYINNEHKAIPG